CLMVVILSSCSVRLIEGLGWSSERRTRRCDATRLRVKEVALPSCRHYLDCSGFTDSWCGAAASTARRVGCRWDGALFTCWIFVALRASTLNRLVGCMAPPQRGQLSAGGQPHR